jgi:hypothetical protein
VEQFLSCLESMAKKSTVSKSCRKKTTTTHTITTTSTSLTDIFPDTSTDLDDVELSEQAGF